jgi:hypothetical protein
MRMLFIVPPLSGFNYGTDFFHPIIRQRVLMQ